MARGRLSDVEYKGAWWRGFLQGWHETPGAAPSPNDRVADYSGIAAVIAGEQPTIDKPAESSAYKAGRMKGREAAYLYSQGVLGDWRDRIDELNPAGADGIFDNAMQLGQGLLELAPIGGGPASSMLGGGADAVSDFINWATGE